MERSRRTRRHRCLEACTLFALLAAPPLLATEAGPRAWLGLSPGAGRGEIAVTLHTSGLEIHSWSFHLCPGRPDVIVVGFRRSPELAALLDETPPESIAESRADEFGNWDDEVFQSVVLGAGTSGALAEGESGLPLGVISYAVSEVASTLLCDFGPTANAVITTDQSVHGFTGGAEAVILPPLMALSPPESYDFVTASLEGAGVQGWSFGICHEPSAAAVVDLRRSAGLDTIRDGFPPSFSLTQVAYDAVSNRAGVVQAVVLDFYTYLTLPLLAGGYPILDVEYDVAAETPVEVCSGLEGAGEPVNIAITARSYSVYPEVGRALLKPKPLREKFALRTLPPESGEVVNVILSSDDLAIQGWSFALCHTAGAAEVAEFAPSPQLLQLVGGEPPQFLHHEITPADPFVALVQTVLLGTRTDPVTLGPFPEGIPVLGVRYRVLAEDHLKFCDFVGGVRFRNEVIHDGVRYEPRTREGSRLVLGALGTDFIRGDADVNGEINLTDAVYVFSALFLGGRPLPCLDAADANDVGRVDISDPIYILNFLFLGGPEPRPPFPQPGTDLSPRTALGCERGL